MYDALAIGKRISAFSVLWGKDVRKERVGRWKKKKKISRVINEHCAMGMKMRKNEKDDIVCDSVDRGMVQGQE